MQLSDNDLQELIRIKKTGGKKVEALQKKRVEIAARLAAIDVEIAKLTGEDPVEQPKAGKRRGASRSGAERGKVNFVGKMREVFSQAGTPLRAREIADGLLAVGVKIKDIAKIRKRISVALATSKCFEQVSRGVYKLKEE